MELTVGHSFRFQSLFIEYGHFWGIISPHFDSNTGMDKSRKMRILISIFSPIIWQKGPIYWLSMRFIHISVTHLTLHINTCIFDHGYQYLHIWPCKRGPHHSCILSAHNPRTWEKVVEGCDVLDVSTSACFSTSRDSPSCTEPRTDCKPSGSCSHWFFWGESLMDTSGPGIQKFSFRLLPFPHLTILHSSQELF